MSPGNIKGVDLHEGEWGTVGSVIVWDFFHDGKLKVAKEVIEAIDEEKKSVCFKVIGGDILEAYTKFLITVHVDTHGEENVVTWTFHYEKVNEKIEDPEKLSLESRVVDSPGGMRLIDSSLVKKHRP
ncbi:hypothetical protein E3N88_40540 [Mikania micrantha]|uniref:Bet v I/Major latex protein domain-containing protein n=1 Tax=Mikania micrantha TaxID=192012 RepID=A0A5N6LMW4_9ASTR|nr:hypothetical protein E3N88_40540 [Mikania micrantha]